MPTTADTSQPQGRMQSKPKSWVPRKARRIEEVSVTSMVHELSQEHVKSLDKIVPWYLTNLPSDYFQQVGEATRKKHLKGVVALKEIDQDISVQLRSKPEGSDDTEVTFMRTNAKPGVLLQMLDAMPPHLFGEGVVLRRVKVFTTEDSTLCLNIFTFGQRTQERTGAMTVDGEHILAHAADVMRNDAGADSQLFSRESLSEYFSLCEPAYVRNSCPEYFLTEREMYARIRGTDSVEVQVDGCPESKGAWLMIAVANVVLRTMLSKLAALMTNRGLNVQRAYVDLVSDPTNAMGDWKGSIAMIRVLVNPVPEESLPQGSRVFGGTLADLDSPAWVDLMWDVQRIKWLDSKVVNMSLKNVPGLSMRRVEVITAMCHMLHGPLSKVNPYSFSRHGMLTLVQAPRYFRHVKDVADLFVARFNPDEELPNEAFQLRVESLRQRIRDEHDEAARTLFLKMVDVVELTLRTNLFLPNRYALAFRIDPKLMMTSEKQHMPFGVIFVHGEHFDGFHNRFQNIARGGLRLVTPASSEQHAIESARCYDEVYGLSYAQQLKNKDIPEGGSKAVVLVDTSRVDSRFRHVSMRLAVKAFADALLDLTVPVKQTRSRVKDFLGIDELIYLGPDEQVTSEDINYIIKRAGQRGYPIPAAFMSSKPGAGINHKTYGVTSEGVAVFLDVAMRNKGINPNSQPFTVKITGGPDGDVAGNLMRILDREYGNNAVIVGVADGSGCAEDPQGLPHDELLRLFKEEKPICDLNPTKLSATAKVHRANTDDGARMRNTMHNRLKADVFVPAGGRPNTINASNWEDYLIPGTTTPSAPLIVEGANIFITNEARVKLNEVAGVLIVKDSSANKCGVITSSYEICASMLIEEEEFLSIKDELVNDVLVQLRHLARMEAELLFREHNNYPGSLPEFSERISSAINKGKRVIGSSLENMVRNDTTYNDLMPLFLEHLPKKLVDLAGHRIDTRIPLDYVRNAFASCLASKLLYREGVNFVELQPDDRLAELAKRYFSEERRLKHLINAVQTNTQLNDKDREEVRRLLSIGGVRSALDVF